MTFAFSVGLAALWLLLASLFVGVGAIVLGGRAGLDEGWPAMHSAFWAGAATVTGTLMTWHLFLPVDALALGVVSAGGATGCVVYRRSLLTSLKACRLPSALAGTAGAVWVANHALNASALDDLFYEYQAVRWYHDFPIVPGLANLHGRLGFNQSHHLLSAAFSVGPLAGNVHHVVNGLFVTAILMYLAGGLADLTRRQIASRSALLRGMLLAPALGLVLFGEFGPMISTLKADSLVACAVFVLACFLTEFADATSGTPAYRRIAATLLLTSALVVSVKLNAAAFGLVVTGGVIGRLFMDRRRGNPPAGHAIGVALVLSALILGLVPLRGVVLSGYPAYPADMLGLNVDWRVPEAQAAADRMKITSLAQRRPTDDPATLRGWGWIVPWGRRAALIDKFTIVVPAALALMCLAVRFTGDRTAGRAGSDAPGWVIATLMAASGAALAVWLAAPASRFGFAYFWIVASWALVWIHEAGELKIPVALAAAGGVAVSLLAIELAWLDVAPADRLGDLVVFVAASVWFVAFVAFGHRGGLTLAAVCVGLALMEPINRLAADVVHGRLGEAAAMAWLTPDRYGRNTTAEPVARQTLSGLTVYVTLDARYDSPIPNTRCFNPYLELRRPGSLASGFRADRLPKLSSCGYAPGVEANSERLTPAVVAP